MENSNNKENSPALGDVQATAEAANTCVNGVNPVTPPLPAAAGTEANTSAGAGAATGANSGAGGATPAIPAPSTMPPPYWQPIAAPPPKAPAEPFTATKADGLFAIAALVLGFLFCRWGLKLAGWGVTAFTALFAAAVLAYAHTKGIKPKPQSWFWLCIMQGCGLAYSLWPANLLAVYQALLLLGSGVYWCGSLFDVLLQGKTGSYIVQDAANLFALLPFKNFSLLPHSLKALKGKSKENEAGGENSRKAISIVFSVVLALAVLSLMLAFILPLLIRADSAGFGRMVNSLTKNIAKWFNEFIKLENVWAFIWQAVLGIPVAFYITGLAAGTAHKRYAKSIDIKKTQKRLTAARVAPHITVLIVLAGVCAVYTVFIACQIPHFFSAFRGIKPQGYSAYSEFAREGFFELCRIAFINLIILLAAGGFGKINAKESAALRVLNILLSALTLLVIATAFSKMGLYISMQGFTPKRIMTCVFMVFLAGVFTCSIIMQFKPVQIVRFAAVFGASLLCALCLCNLDGIVIKYNAAGYLNGTLESFDELILLRSGPAGYEAGLEIYNMLDDEKDEEQKLRIAYALLYQRETALWGGGTSADSYMKAKVRALPAPEEDLYDAETAFIKKHQHQIRFGESLRDMW